MKNGIAYYYELREDNSVCITGAETDGSDQCRVIPSEINGHPVTKIGDGAFAKLSINGYLTIPEGITEIGNAAFYNCELIRVLLIPKSVIKIGRFAFN